jgi:hypothetical protein
MTTSSAELLDLATRIESLSGPCRETDALIHWRDQIPAGAIVQIDQAAGVLHIYWNDRKNAIGGYVPYYTKSIDAAMGLVPAGWVKRFSEIRFGLWLVQLWHGDKSFKQPVDIEESGATLPLAIVAASLRARAQEQKP